MKLPKPPRISWKIQKPVCPPELLSNKKKKFEPLNTVCQMLRPGLGLRMGMDPMGQPDPPPPSGDSFILMEDSGFVLMEDGSKILLE